MILEYETDLLALIDNMVSTASDDDLFASGYLRGHISLAVADCEQQGVTEIAQVNLAVESV